MTELLHDAERQAHAEFASRASEEKYRQFLAELYPTWRQLNSEFFADQLREPHLAIGRTAFAGSLVVGNGKQDTHQNSEHGRDVRAIVHRCKSH